MKKFSNPLNMFSENLQKNIDKTLKRSEMIISEESPTNSKKLNNSLSRNIEPSEMFEKLSLEQKIKTPTEIMTQCVNVNELLLIINGLNNLNDKKRDKRKLKEENNLSNIKNFMGPLELRKETPNSINNKNSRNLKQTIRLKKQKIQGSMRKITKMKMNFVSNKIAKHEKVHDLFKNFFYGKKEVQHCLRILETELLKLSSKAYLNFPIRSFSLFLNYL